MDSWLKANLGSTSSTVAEYRVLISQSCLVEHMESPTIFSVLDTKNLLGIFSFINKKSP